MIASFEFIVEFIEHDVGKWRTQGASLRCALFARFISAVFHNTCVEIAVDERDDSIVLDCPLQYLYQPGVIDRVEEAFKVYVH